MTVFYLIGCNKCIIKCKMLIIGKDKYESDQNLLLSVT